MPRYLASSLGLVALSLSAWSQLTFTSIDSDRDGYASLTEYEHAAGYGSAGYDSSWTRACFSCGDTNRDSMLSRREIATRPEVLTRNLPLARGDDPFECADVIEDDRVTLAEYGNFLSQTTGPLRSRELMERFNHLDTSGDGIISRREYDRDADHFGETVRRTPIDDGRGGRPAPARDDFYQADLDRDDRIAYSEFLQLRGWRRGTPVNRQWETDFGHLDTNRDEIITRREYESDRECFCGRTPYSSAPAPAPAPQPRGGLAGLLGGLIGGGGGGTTPPPRDTHDHDHDHDRPAPAVRDIAFQAPYREVHSMNDSNGDGTVTWREYFASNQGRDFTESRLRARFGSIDVNRDERLTLGEFQRYQQANPPRR
jgi:Ca2+-binding EF-hand superfamily protein